MAINMVMKMIQYTLNREDEEPVTTVPGSSPTALSTTFALITPGNSATFKIFTVLTTGAERGSNPVMVTPAGVGPPGLSCTPIFLRPRDFLLSCQISRPMEPKPTRLSVPFSGIRYAPDNPVGERTEYSPAILSVNR